MKRHHFAWGLLAALALPAKADIVDGGNLQIGGQGIFGGTMTVQGNAFSVGGSTLTATAGRVGIGTGTPTSLLTVHDGDIRISTTSGSRGIIFQDGTTQTTAPGGVLQMVSTYTSAAFLCGLIPRDDTAPQSTEGTAVVEASITPHSAASKIVISGVMYAGLPGGSNSMVAAIFKDSGSDAIYTSANGGMTNSSVARATTLQYVESSGSTAARTYKMRCGGEAAGNIRINGENSRVYGGTLLTGFIVQEVVP